MTLSDIQRHEAYVYVCLGGRAARYSEGGDGR